MAKTKSAAAQISLEEIKHVIEVILLVCVLLKALEPILKNLAKRIDLHV